MARKHNLQKAAEDFSAAAYVAEDGAIVSAAILATRGVESLDREWKRRKPLRAGTPFACISLADAVQAEIAGRKAARKKAVA
jgi:hypothetical protein